MEIIVLGKKIETKEITAIYDVERDKKMFRNREAGFIIEFMNNSTMVFKEDIPYECYASEISNIKEKWNDIQKKVMELWEQDKHNLPEISFKN